MKSMKTRITTEVLGLLSDKGITTYGNMTNGGVKSLWWFTKRQDDGLRLTEMGDIAFRQAEIEHYDHSIEVESRSHEWYIFMIKLKKKMKTPYYVWFMGPNLYTKPILRLYDKKISVWLTLSGGITKYVDN